MSSVNTTGIYSLTSRLSYGQLVAWQHKAGELVVCLTNKAQEAQRDPHPSSWPQSCNDPVLAEWATIWDNR